MITNEQMPERTSTDSPRAECQPAHGMGAWLSDERRFWSVFALLLAAFAIVKGSRAARDWALTQASVDYHLGFIKRGLQGAVLHGFGIYSAHSMGRVFYAELLAFLVLLFLVLRGSRLVERVGDARLLAMFAGSYALTLCTHFIGYTDVLNGALAMVLVLIRKPAMRFVVGVPLVVIALLVHENFLLMWLPLVLMTFAIDAFVAETPRARRTALLQGTLLAGIALLFVMTALQLRYTQAQAAQAQQDMAAHADFVPRPDFFFTMYVPSLNNFLSIRGIYRHEQWIWLEHLLSFFLFAPVAAMICRILWRLLDTQPNERSRRWMKLATVVLLLAPLLLNAMGWDVVRWYGFAVIAAMLALAALSRALPFAPLTLTPAERHAILLIIVIGMAGGYGLFDGAQVRPYPFYPSWNIWWAGRF